MDHTGLIRILPQICWQTLLSMIYKWCRFSKTLTFQKKEKDGPNQQIWPPVNWIRVTKTQGSNPWETAPKRDHFGSIQTENPAAWRQCGGSTGFHRRVWNGCFKICSSDQQCWESQVTLDIQSYLLRRCFRYAFGVQILNLRRYLDV